jgi:hypothetical protein
MSAFLCRLMSSDRGLSGASIYSINSAHPGSLYTIKVTTCGHFCVCVCVCVRVCVCLCVICGVCICFCVCVCYLSGWKTMSLLEFVCTCVFVSMYLCVCVWVLSVWVPVVQCSWLLWGQIGLKNHKWTKQIHKTLHVVQKWPQSFQKVTQK